MTTASRKPAGSAFRVGDLVRVGAAEIMKGQSTGQWHGTIDGAEGVISHITRSTVTSGLQYHVALNKNTVDRMPEDYLWDCRERRLQPYVLVFRPQSTGTPRLVIGRSAGVVIADAVDCGTTLPPMGGWSFTDKWFHSAWSANAANGRKGRKRFLTLFFVAEPRMVSAACYASSSTPGASAPRTRWSSGSSVRCWATASRAASRRVT